MPSTPETPALFLRDLATLSPFKRKPRDTSSGTAMPGDELLQVVIETPMGSRHKYSYDLHDRVLRHKSSLPLGMGFPFDFGFVPSTLGGDGDPLDVLVLGDLPTFPGCVVLARLLGVMTSEQTQAGETFRNDRLLAAADPAEGFAHLHTIADLTAKTREQIETFFATYHRLQGKHSRLLAWKDAAFARHLIDEGLTQARKA